ncbi:MAG: hypothetical protein N3B01_08360 [Verrucomicrobiae bacterium]|nr:hypothetical protein [Verrucomicrobiae bacterium]
MAGEPLADGEAGCFYHPSKAACVVCDACGRFLCGLCDVELDGEHYCPPCLEAKHQVRIRSRLESRCVLYDNIALALALLALFPCFLLPVSSPAAIAVAIWGWRKQSGLLRRSKLRFVVAILMAVFGVCVSALFWTAIFAG